jgi:gentisate 1,2-dioxygenase
MKANLDATAGSVTVLPYLKPNGAESMPTSLPYHRLPSFPTKPCLLLTRVVTVSLSLGTSATRIAAGAATEPVQETASSMFHVIEGAGHSIIDGQKFTWKQGDTFCIPSWHEYLHHAAADGETVYLYRCHDMPMIKALGFYRVNGADVEDLVSE